MKTLTITKFDIMSVAKVAAAINAFMGFILGCLFTLMSLGLAGSALGSMGTAFGIGAIIVLPIMYGIMGFIGGLIGAFVFNFIAPKVGGLTFEVEEKMSGDVPTEG